VAITWTRLHGVLNPIVRAQCSVVWQVPYAAHGYGSFFVLSTLDRHYQRDMTLEEALDVLRKCINEIQTRFLVNLPKFLVKCVDKDGIRVISL